MVGKQSDAAHETTLGELRGELRLKGFELSQLGVAHAEKCSVYRQVKDMICWWVVIGYAPVFVSWCYEGGMLLVWRWECAGWRYTFDMCTVLAMNFGIVPYRGYDHMLCYSSNNGTV